MLPWSVSRAITRAWLAEAVRQWRFNAVCGDLGLFLYDAWTSQQTETVSRLARQVCDSLSTREDILVDEIESWQMLEGNDLRCFARGLPAVTTASAIRLGEAIIQLIDGTLPEPPPGTWWFFATEDCAPTIQKRN